MLSGSITKGLLSLAIPIMIMNVMQNLFNVIDMAALRHFADDMAVMPYVAQNIGAENIKRVKQTIIKGTLITTAFGASFGFLSAFFAEQLSSIMSPTPTVIAYSVQKMIIVSSTYFICGINEVIGGVLKGMGKPIFPTVTTMIFMCVLRFVWIYLVYPLLPQNLTFLYLVWPVGWILSIITLLIVYFPAMSKLQKRLLQKQSV